MQQTTSEGLISHSSPTRPVAESELQPSQAVSSPFVAILRKTRSHFRKKKQKQKNTSLPSFSSSLPPCRGGEVFLGTLKEVFAQWDRLQPVSPH